MRTDSNQKRLETILRNNDESVEISLYSPIGDWFLLNLDVLSGVCPDFDKESVLNIERNLPPAWEQTSEHYEKVWFTCKAKHAHVFVKKYMEVLEYTQPPTEDAMQDMCKFVAQSDKGLK